MWRTHRQNGDLSMCLCIHVSVWGWGCCYCCWCLNNICWRRCWMQFGKCHFRWNWITFATHWAEIFVFIWGSCSGFSYQLNFFSRAFSLSLSLFHSHISDSYSSVMHAANEQCWLHRSKNIWTDANCINCLDETRKSRLWALIHVAEHVPLSAE